MEAQVQGVRGERGERESRGGLANQSIFWREMHAVASGHANSDQVKRSLRLDGGAKIMQRSKHLSQKGGCNPCCLERLLHTLRPDSSSVGLGLIG